MLGTVVISSKSLLLYLISSHQSFYPPAARCGICRAQTQTLSHLTGELVLSTWCWHPVAHFVLGPAHLVCASVCVWVQVYVCVCACVLSVPSVYPSHPLEYTVGTLQWGHQDAIFMDCCMILKSE